MQMDERPIDPLRSFIQHDGGYTTIASALAILLCLVMLFSLANVAWITTTSADVQQVADAVALAGADTIASYETIVTICDAISLSLGISGVITLGVGTVAAAVPAISSSSPTILKAGTELLEARTVFAERANVGLSQVARALPTLVVLNGAAVATANSTERITYYGTALALPIEGESSQISNEAVDDEAKTMTEKGEEIRNYSDESAEKQEEALNALEEGWYVDCGNQPYSLYERASHLSSLPPLQNPYYPTADGWDFDVPLNRARAYYQARLSVEQPAGGDIESIKNSAARRAFYEFALHELNQSSADVDGQGWISNNLHALPANTAQVRETSLFTEVRWPITQEPSGAVIHCDKLCPGAQGPSLGLASLSQIELGSVAQCDTCKFTITDIGRTPAASTSIENGFEYHWRKIVEASERYEQAQNSYKEVEERAKEPAQESVDAFEEALKKLSKGRINVVHPGKAGCIALVFDRQTRSPSPALASFLSSGATIQPRAAIAGANLQPDQATDQNNVLASFFDSLAGKEGFTGSAGGALDSLFGLWGHALLSYGAGVEGIESTLEKALTPLHNVGLGSLAQWIQTELSNTLELTGFVPIDLSLKKPVLVNSVEVCESAGLDGAILLRKIVTLIPANGSNFDPISYLELLLNIQLERLESGEIDLGDISLPGTETNLPMTIDLEGDDSS